VAQFCAPGTAGLMGWAHDNEVIVIRAPIKWKNEGIEVTRGRRNVFRDSGVSNPDVPQLKYPGGGDHQSPGQVKCRLSAGCLGDFWDIIQLYLRRLNGVNFERLPIFTNG
jgi:hypothetical protein